MVDRRWGWGLAAGAVGVRAALAVGSGPARSAAAGPPQFLQHHSGAWPSIIPSTGDSDVDSSAMAATALAVQALTLDGSRYAGPLRRARRFLLGEQNRDGGFAIAATGPQSSDVRASTQVLGGLIGTSFGTLALR